MTDIGPTIYPPGDDVGPAEELSSSDVIGNGMGNECETGGHSVSA